ncbi:MAG: helix-turn-helix domain-containing protein [Firmicutes bacterium]|nr:helix-turn-helix domain-containing protein [Bacillota bacterium]
MRKPRDAGPEATGSASECPVELALQVIGGKWTLLILRDLLTGPKRFGELRRSLGGVSPKTLAQRLRELEQDGILTRTVYPEVPLRVEYALTREGETLSRVVDVIRDWGEHWRGERGSRGAE